jgi:formiminotetrahydrofolate cyclodeaminase
LIDTDSEAYEAVVAAYRLPKSTSAEQAARRAAIEDAMRGATEVPLETMRACQQALRGAAIIARNGNPNAATDTGVGIQLLLAGLRGAGMNVDVNTASISDDAYVRRVKTERDELESDGAADAATAAGLLAGPR